MSLDEEYILKMQPALEYNHASFKVSRMNNANAYQFSCPFCSHLLRTHKDKEGKKQSKPPEQKRQAIFMPLKECNSKYVFMCRRGYSPECKGSGGGEKSRQYATSLLNFMLMYKPYLAERYKAVKDQTLDIGSKPNFNN